MTGCVRSVQPSTLAPMTARIIIPGRLARAGVASRHPVAYAGVKFLDAVHRGGR